MQKLLIVSVGTSSQDATAIAVANGCAGFYTGIPRSMQAQATAEGWTLPCVIEVDENDTVVSWTPV